jgi:hypothetical protein
MKTPNGTYYGYGSPDAGYDGGYDGGYKTYDGGYDGGYNGYDAGFDGGYYGYDAGFDGGYPYTKSYTTTQYTYVGHMYSTYDHFFDGYLGNHHYFGGFIGDCHPICGGTCRGPYAADCDSCCNNAYMY